MSIAYTFFGKLENGVLSVINRLKVTKDMLDLEDGFVEVSMRYKKQRSTKQNRYFHGLLVPEFRKALNEVGYRIKNDEESKAVIKSMFLTRAITSETGAPPVHYVQDTSTLSPEEMNILIDEVIAFAAENMNYQIPYPGEKMEFDF